MGGWGTGKKNGLMAGNAEVTPGSRHDPNLLCDLEQIKPFSRLFFFFCK